VDEPVETGEGEPFDPSGAVTLAYVHGDHDDRVAYSFHRSVVEMLGHDMANHGRVLQGGFISMRCGTNGLVESRNRAVRDFLLGGNADWMMWLDTDMGFAPDIIDRLMEAADPEERPIVGALCFAQRADETDGMGGWRTMAFPTVYDWDHVGDQMGFAVRWDYPSNTVTRVAGTGSAAVLIHRSVFEKIADKLGPVWYDRLPNTTTGQLISEDLSLCIRAGAFDIPVHVHTGVPTTHAKKVWIAEQDYWRERALNPPPVPGPPQADATPDPTVVIPDVSAA
jgi:hypothetical protein